VLLGSVQRLLPNGETALGAVVLRTVTGWALLAAVSSGVLVFATVAALLDTDRPPRVVWSVLVAVAVGALLTRYRVVALTERGFVLFAGSPIRNVATRLMAPLPDSDRPEKLGGNLATSDWSIGGEIYTVSKRGDRDLEQMVARHRER
jgi:hypothetical protein